MDAFSKHLNEVLVESYRSILKVEERMLSNTENIDLSINEMHMIECIGKNQGERKTISYIAENLSITLPSVTIAINKLVSKGYVQKIKSQQDGRVVYVVLTRKGKKMDSVHRYFHENMVRNITKELSDEEKNAMLKGIIKLNAFFKQKLDILED